MQVNLGSTWAELGDFVAAERELRTALAAAERMGLAHVVGYALDNLGNVVAHLGRYAEARAIEERAAALGRAQGDPRLEGTALTCLAMAEHLQGAYDEAERWARAAAGLLEAASPHRATALAVLSRALNARGRAAEALEVATEVMRMAEDLGGLDEFEALARLAWAEALHASGSVPDAREALREAKQRLLARAARITDESLRESFLQHIPENARTLALSGAWSVDG
jgi:tetratricopeptide (TPR) repeat protein